MDVWVCVCVFMGQVQLSHGSLLGNMKPDKQRNYAASYGGESCTGTNGNRGEGLEAGLRALMAGLSECV